MSKKKLTKEEQKEIKAIEDKLGECVKYIVENVEHLDEYRRDDLIEAINPIGANIKITSLKDYYLISEFCEANNVPFESNAYY